MKALRNDKKINLPSDFAIFRYTSLKSLVLAPISLRFSPRLSKNGFIILGKFIFSSFLKILSLFFAVFLISTNTTFAQSKAANLSEEQKEEIKKNLEAYAVALQLSEAQKPKFEEITKKYVKQMIALKNSGGNRMSKYKKVKSIRKNKDAEMKSLLSKDQYKLYLENKIF